MTKMALGKRCLSMFCAIVLAGSGVVVSSAAFASSTGEENNGVATCDVVTMATVQTQPVTDDEVYPSEALSTEGFITGVAWDRATPILEMLGVTSVVEGLGALDAGYGEGLSYDSTWKAARYWLTSSYYNTAPSPYLANLGTGLGTQETSASMVSSLVTYGTDDASDAVWNMKPDIIVNYGDADASADMVSGVEGFENYDPAVFATSDWDDGSYSKIISTMEAVAEAADKADAADGSRSLRYGSATDIVDSYKHYIYGTQGYIAKQIIRNGVEMKTYAYVRDVTVDADGGYSWTIGVTDEAGNYIPDIYDETILGDGTLPTTLANNLFDTLGTTATTSQLADKGVDLIIATCDPEKSEDVIEALQAAGLLEKTYFTLRSDCGSIYDEYTGIEAGQNIAHILSCLYPDYVDDQWMGYYLENFYHLNQGGILNGDTEKEINVMYVASEAFNGVRNWYATDADGDGTLSIEELTSWDGVDSVTYNADTVQLKIDDGWAYYNGVTWIDKPKVVSNTTYNGREQRGVEDGEGYILSGDVEAKNCGTYNTKVTLEEGYRWADGTNSQLTLTWGISKVRLTARYEGETIAANQTPALVVTVEGFVNGETPETADGYIPPTITPPDFLEAGRSYTLTPEGGSAENYIFFSWESGELRVTEATEPDTPDNPDTPDQGTILYKELSGGTNGTRYDTMKAIVSATFDSSTAAVLATGDNFPDALAAGSLAGVLDAPVVLVGKNNTQQAIDVLKSLGTTKLYVIGGDAAISGETLSEVQLATGITSAQRLQGTTRQETAVDIASEVAKHSSQAPSTAIIATGKAFADALSISPYAYITATPIYLTQDDGTLDSKTLSAIKECGYTDYIFVGGTSVVSDDVIGQLGVDESVTTRLGGKIRYETSAFIATFSAAANVGLSYGDISIATGENFPDALAGSCYVAQNGGILLLANESSQDTYDVLTANKKSIESVTYLGGTGAVSNTTRANVRAALE